MEEYELKPLTKEEGDALTKDMMEVLEKHGAELGVKAQIEILKRVPIKQEDGIPSPFMPPHGDNPPKTEETPETKA